MSLWEPLIEEYELMHLRLEPGAYEVWARKVVPRLITLARRCCKYEDLLIQARDNDLPEDWLKRVRAAIGD